VSEPARVVFEKVRKRFGETDAVHDVDLDVAPGECLVLLGPSGCGKTTLLRLVAGLESVDSGVIRIGERVVNGVLPAERDIAMVFQNYALYPHFSAFENIAFPLRNKRVAAAEITERVRSVAKRLELDALLDRKPAQLSGGQQQRVALARAIVRSPAVFLMDEPLSNLDAQLRVQTRGELKRLQQELGVTTIYVTHDQSEAMTLGSRVALLRAGRIEQLGAPLDLYRRPANRFVASFLGSPAINLWPGEIDGARVRAAGALLAVAPELRARIAESERFEVGVRPEDIEIRPSSEGGGRILVVEPMGNETIVTLAHGGETVVARAPADSAFRPGDAASFQIPAERLLLFRALDGGRIG